MAEVLTAEVVIVGAGPAGIAAASRIAEGGRDVLLIDENPVGGGQIWRHRSKAVLPRRAGRWLDRLAASSTRVLAATAVIDGRSDGLLIGDSDRGPIEIRAEVTILATGARELFLPFPGWTLPGVMGVGAAQALVKDGLDVRGRRVVVAGSGPLLLPVSRLLRRSGAEVVLMAEQAPKLRLLSFCLGLIPMPGKIGQAIGYRAGTWTSPYRPGVWVESAAGDDRVREVTLTDGTHRWSKRCDLLCAAYGLVPNVELASWLGCGIEGGRVVVDDHQQTDRSGIYCVGEATGVGGVELALVEGQIAAAHLLRDTSGLAVLRRRRDRLARFAARLERAFSPRRELADRVRPDTVVCRCEDVQYGRLDPAWSLRQAKLYARIGMGPCQGRVCGVATRFLFGWESDSVRPPLKPCRVGHLRGPAA